MSCPTSGETGQPPRTAAATGRSLPSTVLIIGPAWVGDMVLSQVLYRLLAATRPGVAIDVLAPAWSAPLLARMPEVRRALTQPLGHGELALGRRWRQGRELRERGYGQAIVLPNSFKSALPPRAARIPLRSGWRGEWRHALLNDLRVLDPEALPTMAQRFAALGLPAGAPLPSALPPPALLVDADAAQAVGRRFALEPARPLLALCPGAEFGPAKCWPAPHYAAVAAQYLARGWQVVLLGAAGDRAACAALHSALHAPGRCIDLAGRTTLAQAIDLLSLATAVVSNDSGLMHVAAALARPLVAVYGPTSPAFTPPLSPQAAVLRADIECAPCFQRHCPLGHHRCMREATTPAQVVARLDALLAANGGAP